MVFLSKLLFNILGWSSGKVVEKKHKKYQNEAQELELLRKRSAQILADRRK